MVMVLFVLADWNDTSMGNFAHDVLELDRGVIDAEVMMEPLFHVAQNAFTY